MDSKENCSNLHSEIEKSSNENLITDVLTSHSQCQSNVVSQIIPEENAELPPVINSIIESQDEPVRLSISESCVKDHLASPKLEKAYVCLDDTVIPPKLELEKDNTKCNETSRNDKPNLKDEPFEIFSDTISQHTSNSEEICIDEKFSRKPLLDKVDNFLQAQNTLGVTPSKNVSSSYMFQQGVKFTSTPLNDQNLKNGIRNEFHNLSMIKEEETFLEESEGSAVKIESENLPLTAKEGVHEKIENKPSNLSILRKDELSLLIDFPRETVLTEEKNDLNNHCLTLSVKNSETIIYKSIIDKTVDDLLLEGNELERVENFLETERDKKEILDKAVALKSFVSPNDDENRDNNDPEWELLKKLETDDERYKAVRKIWKNLAIPDLKQNLSTYNWRKKNALPALKNIVPIKTIEIGRKKKKLIYECTEVFDVGMKKLEDFRRRQYDGIKLDCDNETSIMASLNKKPRLDRGFAPLANRDYQTHLDKLNMCFQERLQRHRDAKKEIKAVHGFYNGLKNQGNGGYGNVMFISHKERQDILEIESMINHYTVWYP